MKKIILMAVVMSMLVITGCAQINKQKSAPIIPDDSQAENNEGQLVGGDKDEHGCIGSAGYMWCEPKNKCLRIWEETCYTNAEQEIQYILAKKYNKLATDVTVTATKKTSDYMVGGVSFAAPGLPSPGEGGGFLAAREGNMWTLVYDGNGSVDCDTIKQNYEFPQDMLTGFCD